MKINNYFILAIMALFVIVSCGKDDPVGPQIDLEEPDDTDPVFIAVDPDINDGIITFEETGPSFDVENLQGETREAGNWGRFGGLNDQDITIEYVDNPAVDDVNGSSRVVKVTEPAGIESWAGFYFMLENNISFPAGQEAISLHFYSPAAGHNVLLKLEDGLANGSDGKKSTGDLFAVTTGTGWETIVFNIPEVAGERSDIYNTITMILGYGVNNSVETSYHIDNLTFAEPVEVVIPEAPTNGPAAPTYDASEVISIFSDAYTPLDGINFNPNWGQSTVVSTETIDNNTVLKYDNLNYQGTALASPTDFSGKARLHIDYFTGNATTLKFFLISPDGADEGDAAEEIAYDLDVTSAPGEWNSVDIDLSHFATVVDLENVIQFKVEGNGIVYFDNIYFFGGGSDAGTDYNAAFTGTFGGATVADNVYNFPTGSEAWAGFANENADIYPLSFEHGGRITFTGSAASTNVLLNFRFERLPFPDVDPAFSTSNVTVSGSEAVEYTVEIPPQDAANTYSSALLYLVTQDAAVTLTNIVIRSYDAPPSGTNYNAAFTGTFGGATVADNVYNFPAGSEAWAGFANENADIYPLSFPNGGRIAFNGSTAGTDVSINFRFERLPFPDVDPAFSTSNVTVSGSEVTPYTVEIPPQDAANTYSSVLLYLVTQDADVTLTDIVITSFD
ncbi:MAG: hypothetical protein P8O78_02780 [Flavobacteriaceae bacterium]|nr:hypothetical protein [Flavobacteriaceae bacterium]